MWNFKWDARCGERALRAHDSLRDRRLRHEERSRDLAGRQTAEQTERQRNARGLRKHGMARDEDQPQKVVADVVVERVIELRR